MPNSCDITIYFLPEDADYFEPLLDMEPKGSEAFPGLMEGTAVGEPEDLSEFKARRFFGMHGSHAGAYPAYKLVCPDGAIFSHVCDEEGSLSLLGCDLVNLMAPPIQISEKTIQFVLVFREVVKSMLDSVRVTMEGRMKELEEEEAAKKAADNPGP